MLICAQNLETEFFNVLPWIRGGNDLKTSHFSMKNRLKHLFYRHICSPTFLPHQFYIIQKPDQSVNPAADQSPSLVAKDCIAWLTGKTMAAISFVISFVILFVCACVNGWGWGWGRQNPNLEMRNRRF